MSTSTLHARLAELAHTAPDAPAYTFLHDDPSKPPSTRTWSALHRRTGQWARTLQQAGLLPGDRALVVFEEGLDYLEALFGCMRAGVLAVPAHPPDPRRLDRTLPRLHAIHRDCEPRAMLSTAELHDVTATDPELAGLMRLVPPPDSADPEPEPLPAEDRLAYLQYTSGSTADPKGVMIRHGHLLHQLADFDTGYAHTGDDIEPGVIVSWIPATHDLGLVYGRFMGLYKGLHTVFFAPATFMKRPRLWLEALTEWRGTHSPSPNFGFEYAARRVRDVQGLDLSHVRVLLNGAEPIRRRSEAAFTERFAPAGLPPHAITHAMGMSESTAKIVTEPIDRVARFLRVDPTALADDHVVVRDDPDDDDPDAIEVASNGRTVLDTEVCIVDPDTHEDLGEDRVGELWVSGTTVADGYFGRDDATRETFRAHTAEGVGPFLRTGDLGFLHDGELYLVGRRKDVVILRGANHHPQDLEWAFDGAHPALRPNCAAAFQLDEGFGVVAEVRPDRVDTPDAVFAAIRGRLSELGVAPDAIALLEPRGLPKTSSGKIKRTAAREGFTSDTLPVLHRWTRPRAAESPDEMGPLTDDTADTPARTGLTAQGVASVLVEELARLLHLDADDIESDQPFKELGVDSVTAVELAAASSDRVGRDVPATWLWDHPTVDALSAAIAGSNTEQATTVDSSSPPTPRDHRAEVAAMSDADAEAALLAELAELEDL